MAGDRSSDAESNVTWDHSTHRSFFDYYANESESESTVQRFLRIQAAVLRIAAQEALPARLDVADVGCGAGTQCRIWAVLGHRVHGVDINEPLILLARERAKQGDLDIRYEVGTATALPWPDGSMDVCLLPALLEHVADWQCCLREVARVLRPNGLLYLDTTNVLCPIQEEFNLPLYSWYPAIVKQYCERLAVTSRPALANYATYPAVHWFSFYSLRRFLKGLGFRCMDRFDLIDLERKGRFAAIAVDAIRGSRLLRFAGHVASPFTSLVALRTGAGA